MSDEATTTESGGGFQLPSMPAIPDWVPELLMTVLGLVPYAIALYFTYKGCLWLYKFAMSQWVVGEPNEWVILMRGGEVVSAGRGLSCFKSPWDQVAKFPSEHIKVELSTEQVTQEMQGIQVQTMIEWAVDKNAPLKAYKNLDLASGSYNTANDILKSMASAIVRNMIANSTIEKIIENRREIRDSVIKEMTEVVQGWGVHLVTVEVLDVRICSGNLFKDMQTKFREDQVKKATLEKLCVQNTIYFDSLERSLETAKRNADTKKITEQAKWANDLKQARVEVEEMKRQCAIDQVVNQRKCESRILQRQNDLTMELKEIENKILQRKRQVDNSITFEQQNRLVNDQDDAMKKREIQESIKQSMMRAKDARETKQAQYDLLKEGLQDPVIRKIKTMEIVEDLYNGMSLGSIEVNHMGEEDPIVHIMNKFTKMAV